jgi:membrane-anchored mycosin MYCP
VPAVRRGRPLPIVLGLTAALGVLLLGPKPALGASSTDGYQNYYTVASSYQGKPENLGEIAGRFHGSSARSNEIFDLNAGRRQPDGATRRCAAG